MFHLLLFLLVLLLFPSSQSLPAEGWETYAFNQRLLSQVFLSFKWSWKSKWYSDFVTFFLPKTVVCSGSSEPGPGEKWRGGRLHKVVVHQGLLLQQLHLPLAHQQQERQVQLVLLLSVLVCWKLHLHWNRETMPTKHHDIRFAYVRTDSEGKASYTYTRSSNGQSQNYYLHYYDEGLFYNGFWVVNDLETGYVETEGRVFIYNSENDDCPEVVNTHCNNIIIKIWFPLGRLPPTIGTSGKEETGNTTPTYIWRPADHLLHLCCAIWNL